MLRRLFLALFLGLLLLWTNKWLSGYYVQKLY